MAKYTVTYSCGHDGMIELFGKHKDREFRLQKLHENGLCPECYHQKSLKDREVQAAKDAEWAAQAEAPAWTEGSEKQRKWAENIRRQFVVWAKSEAMRHLTHVTYGWDGERENDDACYSMALLESSPFDLEPLAEVIAIAEEEGPGNRSQASHDRALDRARRFLELVQEAFGNTSAKFWIDNINLRYDISGEVSKIG